jgi:hypothetical protein
MPTVERTSADGSTQVASTREHCAPRTRAKTNHRRSTQSPDCVMTPLRKAYRDVTAQAVVVQQRFPEYRRLETEARTRDGFGTFGRSCAFEVPIESSGQPQHKPPPTIGPSPRAKPHLGRKTHRLKRTLTIRSWSGRRANLSRKHLPEIPRQLSRILGVSEPFHASGQTVLSLAEELVRSSPKHETRAKRRSEGRQSLRHLNPRNL